MKLSFFALLLFFCPMTKRTACSTTVTVKDCSGGVAGARVTIKTCHPASTVTLIADKNGSAYTDICQDNICDMNVAARADTKSNASQSWRDNCQGNNSNYACVFDFCQP